MKPCQRVLITGGRGRLAALLSASLSAAGYEVVLSSRVADARYIDVHESTSTQFLDTVDAVIHLAWSTLPVVAERIPGTEWEVDLPYLVSVLRALSRLAPERCPHFVFFSSGGTVYGEAPTDRGNREEDPCLPIGWYGRAKLSAERLIAEFESRYRMDCSILRASNPYGYAMDVTKPQGLIAHLIHAARSGREFVIWGDGSTSKDYIAAEDLCGAVAQLLRQRCTGTLNLGSGTSHSVNEIVTMVREVTGRDFPVTHRDGFPWDVACSRLDISRIRNATGWAPRIALDAGITELWRRTDLDFEESVSPKL